MNKLYNYLFVRRHPLVWALAIILIFSILMVVNYYWVFPNNPEWMFVAAFIGVLMYGVYSAFMLFITKKIMLDWNQSFIGFLLVAATLFYEGMLISGKSWDDLSNYTPILKVILGVALIIMSMSIMARKVLEKMKQLDR
ncbi:MAG: hypothetical protein IT216_04240 [Saprospiraceae bacterium]|nr:hypothetical protein [Saprospiraceae bacterium]